ncbi:glucosaminidase domain-containing protein [Fusibacter tunisiensis]|uniref:Beta-N-acetylglucosaminidase n=1 Tax=Fusibacter tunisiensis TaxID=1008308 RepID=A0ABS2MTZ0_9FIRM|nr:glucosaminidase domain-containing protein [Fusibacter tunisiensis]MBM7562859.1 beta-N-acetylglucosaminidase [Fusibacter tunisiensis]
MGIKIDLNSKIKSSFEGPSSDYRLAQNRFKHILETKLGVVTRAQENPGQSSSVSGAGPDNIGIPSGVTADLIDSKLKGTPIAGLGHAFVEAEKKHGVNSIFLASLAVHESAYGSSAIAQDKKNLFGFGAFDASPYAKAYTFDSFEQGIDHVAGYLAKNYLNETGRYYNGVSVESVGKKYATDPNWANAIEKIMKAMVE